MGTPFAAGKFVERIENGDDARFLAVARRFVEATDAGERSGIVADVLNLAVQRSLFVLDLDD